MGLLRFWFVLIVVLSICTSLTLILSCSNDGTISWMPAWQLQNFIKLSLDAQYGIKSYPYIVPRSWGRNHLTEITPFSLVDATADSNLKACEQCAEERCKERCSSFELVHHKLKKDSSEGRVRLFTIPVDALGWADSYERTVSFLVDQVKSTLEYIRFRGSDHVFICLQEGCTGLGKELGKALANEKGTRAIFAGINLDEAALEWPCPLRVVNLRHPSSSVLEDVDKILKASTLMIEKRNRWVCADESNPPNHWDIKHRIRDGIINKEFGFSICSIPKSGSTMVKMLMRRMEGFLDWKATNASNWDPKRNGLTMFRKLDNTQKDDLRKNLGFVTSAVVRDPISRLLSGYLDKIKDRREYYRVAGLREYVRSTGHTPPSFSEFVIHLVETSASPDKNDAHFKIQSGCCAHRIVEHDFVTYTESMYEDFKELGESLGFWEKYGASGWTRSNSTEGAFGEKSINTKTHSSGGLIWQYYTEELMIKVYNYYKEDFDRFGFSIEEILATNPARQNTSG